jgi:hypothetical protein
MTVHVTGSICCGGNALKGEAKERGYRRLSYEVVLLHGCGMLIVLLQLSMHDLNSKQPAPTQ